MSLFRHAVFELSVAKPQDLPDATGPEIAFAGRSNAGKSSAINTLVGHTRLAFVSKTPGRTQLINLFRLRNGAALVDLPGYGYADVPEKIRKQWQGLLETYLARRQALAGLVMIMDARRPLTDLDRQTDPLPADQGGQADPPGTGQGAARGAYRNGRSRLADHRAAFLQPEEAGHGRGGKGDRFLAGKSALSMIDFGGAKKKAPGQRGEAGGQLP